MGGWSCLLGQDSRGIGQSGRGCQGAGGQKGPKPRPTSVPPRPAGLPPPRDQHLAGEHLCTHSSSSWRSVPGSCLCLLSPFPHTHQAGTPPGVSAPAPQACLCLGCVCLWLTVRPLLTCLPLILSCSQALGTGLVNSKCSLRACRQHPFGGASSQGSCWLRSPGLEDARPLPASLFSLLSSLCPTPTWLLLYNQINKSLSPESSFLLAVLQRPGNTPSPSYSKGATGEDLVRPPGLFGGCALCPSCCPFSLYWLNTSSSSRPDSNLASPRKPSLISLATLGGFFCIFKNNFLSLFLTVLGLCCCLDFSCGKQGLLSSCRVQASRCCGFSCGAQALGTWPSVAEAHGLSSCGSQALEHRFSSCDTWA